MEQIGFFEAPCRFTFHYVSIKSTGIDDLQGRKYKFTFHYVSIKSQSSKQKTIAETNLHSTMYLLNLPLPSMLATKGTHLHSTMYLLNPHRKENTQMVS